MLFVLGMAVTIFVAFVRQNVQLSRAAQFGDAQALLVAVPPAEASAVGDASADRDGAGMWFRQQPGPKRWLRVRTRLRCPPRARPPPERQVRGGTLRMDQPNAAGRSTP